MKNYKGEREVLSYRNIEANLKSDGNRAATGQESLMSVLALHRLDSTREEKGPIIESEPDSNDEHEEEIRYKLFRQCSVLNGQRSGGLSGKGQTVLDIMKAPPQVSTRRWEDAIAWGGDSDSDNNGNEVDDDSAGAFLIRAPSDVPPQRNDSADGREISRNQQSPNQDILMEDVASSGSQDAADQGSKVSTRNDNDNEGEGDNHDSDGGSSSDSWDSEEDSDDSEKVPSKSKHQNSFENGENIAQLPVQEREFGLPVSADIRRIRQERSWGDHSKSGTSWRLVDDESDVRRNTRIDETLIYSNLNNHLATGNWESNIVWNADEAESPATSFDELPSYAGGREVLFAARIPQDDPEILLKSSVDKADRAVKEVASRMKRNLSFLGGMPGLSRTKHHGDAADDRAQEPGETRDIRARQSILKMHQAINQWIGFRGQPTGGKLGYDCAKEARRKRYLEMSNVVEPKIKTVTKHAHMAIDHKMLSTREPPVYSLSNISFHRPLLLPTAMQSMQNGEYYKYGIVWELGAFDGGCTILSRVHQNSNVADGSNELKRTMQLSLNSKKGKPVVLEYAEEHPLLGLNPGMYSVVKRLQRHKTREAALDAIAGQSTETNQEGQSSSVQRPVEIGYTVDLPPDADSGLLGNLPERAGERATLIENPLFCAPAVHQKLEKLNHGVTQGQHKTTDYLVCVSKDAVGFGTAAYKRGYILPMPETFLVGQLQPKVEVPRPEKHEDKNKKKILDLRIVNYLYHRALQHAKSNLPLKDTGFVFEHEIVQNFDKFVFNYQKIKNALLRLKENLCVEMGTVHSETGTGKITKVGKGGKGSKTKWRLKGSQNIRQAGVKAHMKKVRDEYAEKVTPEDICKFESMLEGQYRLIHAGLHMKGTGGIIGRLKGRKEWGKLHEALKKLKLRHNYRRRLLQQLNAEMKELMLKNRYHMTKDTELQHLRLMYFLDTYITRVKHLVNKDEEQMRCAEYIYNLLRTTPWNLTSNYISAIVKGDDNHPLLVKGVGDPSGSEEGFSYCIDRTASQHSRGRRHRQGSEGSQGHGPSHSLGAHINSSSSSNVANPIDDISHSNGEGTSTDKFASTRSRMQAQIRDIAKNQMQFLKGQRGRNTSNTGNTTSVNLQEDSRDSKTSVRSDENKRKTSDILSSLFELKLSSAERKARGNYSDHAKKEYVESISIDEIHSDKLGINGWANLTPRSGSPLPDSGNRDRDTLRKVRVVKTTIFGKDGSQKASWRYVLDLNMIEEMRSKNSIKMNGNLQQLLIKRADFEKDPYEGIKKSDIEKQRQAKLSDQEAADRIARLEKEKKKNERQIKAYNQIVEYRKTGQWEDLDIKKQKSLLTQANSGLQDDTISSTKHVTQENALQATFDMTKIEEEDNEHLKFQFAADKSSRPEKSRGKRRSQKRKNTAKRKSSAREQQGRNKRKKEPPKSRLNKIFVEVLQEAKVNSRENRDFFNPIEHVLARYYSHIKYESYEKIVKRPICFKDIQTKCREKAKYTSLREFEADVNLIAKNSTAFNGAENPETKKANTLVQKVLFKLYERKQIIDEIEEELRKEGVGATSSFGSNASFGAKASEEVTGARSSLGFTGEYSPMQSSVDFGSDASFGAKTSVYSPRQSNVDGDKDFNFNADSDDFDFDSDFDE